MSLWRELWADEQGALISAELVAVGTVAVVGTTVGLSTLAKSVNGELKEVAYSIRSLNQSYSVPGHASCRAWTAGSSYTQPDANQSIQDLVGCSAEENKVVAPPKAESPAKKKRKNDEPKKGEQRKTGKQEDDQDQSALPPIEDNKASVEDVDDESRMETVLEPLTDA